MTADRLAALWKVTFSPHGGPTAKPRSATGIRAVFPVVHTPYEHYDSSSLR
jgi:hypothetical protein